MSMIHRHKVESMKNVTGNVTSSENPDEEKSETGYTKTAINRMTKDELVELATSLGFKDAENANANDIKSALIKHLNL